MLLSTAETETLGCLGIQCNTIKNIIKKQSIIIIIIIIKIKNYHKINIISLFIWCYDYRIFKDNYHLFECFL